MPEKTVKKRVKKTTSKKAVSQSKKVEKKTEAPKDSFSIIKTGGKQYKVSSGDVLKIEKIIGDFKVGDTMTFDNVLLTKNGAETKVGTPLVSGAKISAILEKIGKSKKVVVIKYKQKSRYFKNRGHRQPFMQVRIK